MTHGEFIEAIEGYYGEYPRDTMKRMVLQYLNTYIDESLLPDLYAAVLKQVSTQYRAVPDIAIFESISQDWISQRQIGDYRPGRYIPEKTADEKEAAECLAKIWATVARPKEGKGRPTV